MQQQSMFDLITNQPPLIASFDDILAYIGSVTAWPEDDKIMAEIKITRSFSQNAEDQESENINDTDIDAADDDNQSKTDFQTVCSMNLISKGSAASFFFFGKKSLEVSLKKSGRFMVAIPNSQFPNMPVWVSTYNVKKLHTTFALSDVSDFDALGAYLRELKMRKFLMLTPDSIACCNDYLLCSNQASCIKSHWLSSVRCYYRENLEQGHIFFGDRRTI